MIASHTNNLRRIKRGHIWIIVHLEAWVRLAPNKLTVADKVSVGLSRVPQDAVDAEVDLAKCRESIWRGRWDEFFMTALVLLGLLVKELFKWCTRQYMLIVVEISVLPRRR